MSDTDVFELTAQAETDFDWQHQYAEILQRARGGTDKMRAALEQLLLQHCDLRLPPDVTEEVFELVLDCLTNPVAWSIQMIREAAYAQGDFDRKQKLARLLCLGELVQP